MYTDTNYKTKKQLKADVAAGKQVTVWQPGPFAQPPHTYNGTVALEGPHEPALHTWYATAVVKNGIIQSVK